MSRFKREFKFSKEDLPLFLNETLPAERRERLMMLLNKDKELQRSLEAGLEIQTALSSQPKLQPADRVFMNIMEGVRQSMSPTRSETDAIGLSQRRSTWWLGFGSGLALTLSFLLIFWLMIQPGIVLHWETAQNFSTVTYQIYRADVVHAGDFKLVAEIQGQPGAREYTYTDSLLIPGKTYIYRVESITQTGIGSDMQSAWVTSSSTGAFVSLLALLVSSMILGFGLVGIANIWGEFISWRGYRIIAHQ